MIPHSPYAVISTRSSLACTGSIITTCTYHHFPWFIRIDNQFFDPDLEINFFRTLDHIDISDHYPIEAGYVLQR